MKVLYLSGFHPVLEYDECLLLNELGLDWFSTGVYSTPRIPLSISRLNIRKPIDKEVDRRSLDLMLKSNPKYLASFSGLNVPSVRLSNELVNDFDLVFSTDTDTIIRNWDVLKDKTVVWRTVGALNDKNELKMKPLVKRGNVYPVRFSPHEFCTPDSNGGRVIRNYVDEKVYTDWVGSELQTLTFQSWFTQRRTLPANKLYMNLRWCLPCQLYGAYLGRKDPLSEGMVDWDTQVELYKKFRVYFYLPSPASIVAYSFLEPMMTGCPIVTVGPKLGGKVNPINPSEILYEPSEFIENGIDGFYSDDPDELLEYMRLLLDDESLAAQVSVKAREKALKLFSKDQAKRSWKEFFKDTCGCNF